MKDVEILKKAIVPELKIKSKDSGVSIEAKDISYDIAYNLVKAIVEANPEDKFLQECWREGNRNTFGFMGCSKGQEYNWSIDLRMPRTKGTETHVCPRVGEATMSFQVEHGNKATWDKIGDDRVCSYCGSLHPDDLISLIKKHGFGIVEWSTKSYKMYIHRDNIPNASFGAIKFYTPHLEQRHIDEYNALVKQAKRS